MKQTFAIDSLGRIYLNETVRALLRTDESGEFYLHLRDDQIILDKVPRDVYFITGMDEGYMLALDDDILKSKLMAGEGDAIEAVIEEGRIVIPLTEEQAKVQIRYIRTVDEYGRAVLPYYMKKKAGIEKGAHIRWKPEGNGFILEQDKRAKEAVDMLSMVTLPKILRILKKVEFTLEGKRIGVKGCMEQKE